MKLKNEQEAKRRVDEMTDLVAKQFISCAVVAAKFHAGPDRPSMADFDLLEFVEVNLRLLESREQLARILAGEDLRWWTDE